MENFIEYMWYLLTTPFKRVKKAMNMWYTWCKVIGRRFDIIKEDLFAAREEGMVATCSLEMLLVHAADRSLSRFEGEDLESFRKRIAMYAQMCELGGTDRGIILAIKVLGYEVVHIVTAKELYGDDTRWAEFVVIIELKEETKINLEVVRETVRKWKEVGAKENYLYFFRASVSTIPLNTTLRVVCGHNSELEQLDTELRVRAFFISRISMSMQLRTITTSVWYLDGTYTLNGRTFSVNNYEEVIDNE